MYLSSFSGIKIRSIIHKDQIFEKINNILKCYLTLLKVIKIRRRNADRKRWEIMGNFMQSVIFKEDSIFMMVTLVTF